MYTINFVNESQMQGDFVVFQQSPWPTVIYPLAWKTIRAAPNGMPIRFTWEKDYVFFSAQSGQLAPGVRIVPCCQLETSPDSMNEVTLEADFRLINARPGQSGRFAIFESGQFQPGTGATGIGIMGYPIFAAQVVPNLTQIMPAVEDTYFVVFGNNYAQGEVLDMNRVMSNAARVAFPNSGGEVTVILQENGSFRVE